MEKNTRLENLMKVFELYSNDEKDAAQEALKEYILEVSANILQSLQDEEEMLEMMDRDEGCDLADDIAKDKEEIHAEEMHDDEDMDDDLYLEIEEDQYNEDEDFDLDLDDHDFDGDGEHDEHEKDHSEISSRVDDLEDEVEDLEDDFEMLKKEFDALQGDEPEELDDLEDEVEDLDDLEEMKLGKEYKGVQESQLHKVSHKHEKPAKGKSPVGNTDAIDGLEAEAPKYAKEKPGQSAKKTVKNYSGTNTAKKGTDFLKK